MFSWQFSDFTDFPLRRYDVILDQNDVILAKIGSINNSDLKKFWDFFYLKMKDVIEIQLLVKYVDHSTKIDKVMAFGVY